MLWVGSSAETISRFGNPVNHPRPGNPQFPFPRFPIWPRNGEGISDSRLGRERESGNPPFPDSAGKRESGPRLAANREIGGTLRCEYSSHDPTLDVAMSPSIADSACTSGLPPAFSTAKRTLRWRMPTRTRRWRTMGRTFRTMSTQTLMKRHCDSILESGIGSPVFPFFFGPDWPGIGNREIPRFPIRPGTGSRGPGGARRRFPGLNHPGATGSVGCNRPPKSVPMALTLPLVDGRIMTRMLTVEPLICLIRNQSMLE